MNMKLILSKAGFVLKQASPEILIGFGLAMSVGAIFSACSKMKQTEEVKEDLQEELEIIAEEEEKGTKEYFFASFKAGSKSLWRYVKIFWLPILMEILAIVSIWYSHGMMVKRNADLASAAVVLTQQLDKYRERVRDKVGEETENDLFYGLTNKKVGETTVTDENGKEKKVKIYEKVMTDGAGGPFDRVFDKSNHCWQGNNPGNNMVFLTAVLRSARDIMEYRATTHSNGWITINEVLTQLGFDAVEEGFYWGWVWSSYDPKFAHTYIDFGINDFSNAVVRDFVNNYEAAIPLHFNCQPINFKELNLMKI